jgi:serine/threonine protein kinase
MTAPPDCPWTERCEALFDAHLPPGEQQRYEEHLESCPRCQDRFDQAEEDDSLLRNLGRQVGDPTTIAADPTLSHVLERLHDARSPIRGTVEPPDLYFLCPSDQPGTLGTLGGYQVTEVVGQGGMGVVLKAFDPPLHRLVAIKVMAPALAGSATARLRFTREAKAAAAVCHDHIVAVHGVHEFDGLPYLVMQYVEGESLQDRIDRSGPLEVVEAVRIALQTASALAAAHAQGLIHRDIKPANLLLENGLARVKITDFGLARMTDDTQLTQNGVVSGTPEYMAPEQARGEPVDHRADLFSLGSVLYAACTGHPPFRGSTALAVLRHVSDEVPTPIRAVNPDIPEWLQMFVVHLMAKEPAHRFQSAAEVAGLLEGYLAHLRQPMTVPAPILPPSSADAEIECPSAAPRLRPFRWLAAASVVLLCTLGLLAWHLTQAARMAQAGAGSPETKNEFYQDFRGSKPLHPSLKWTGKDGTEVIESGEKGLRIHLSSSRNRTDPVGPLLDIPVEGDVEITTGYQILQADQPKTGNGVGFELYFMLKTPARDALDLIRVKRADGKDLYLCTRLSTVDGKRRGTTTSVPTSAMSGRLRMTRKGREVILSAAEADGKFLELAKYDMEPADLSLIFAAAYPGQSTEPVDIRIIDMKVSSANEIPIPPSETTTTDTATARPAVGKSWLVAVELMGLALTLALVAVGGWIWWRRGRAEHAAAPSAANGVPSEPEAPAVISFPCGGCGKTIRAKAKLAGMKAKCPQCGHPLLVPNPAATGAAQPNGKAAPRFLAAKKGWIAGGSLILVPLVVLGWWIVDSRRSQSSTALAGKSFLNMTLGNEPVAEIEESGFYYQEFLKDEAFRWTDGKARLIIPLRKGESPWGLLVQVKSFRPGAVKTASLRIAVNDRDVMNDRIPVGKWEKSFDLEGIDLGERVVVDLLSDTFAPGGRREGDGRVSEDPRSLGVQVWAVKLLTEAPKPPSPAGPPEGSPIGNNLRASNDPQPAAKKADDPAKGEPDTKDWHEVHRSFKGRTDDVQRFELIGPDADQCVKFEPTGLRITLPLGHPGKRFATGVAWPIPIKGDFEIELSFEILQEPGLKEAGQGTGVFLGIDLNSPTPNRATLTRGARGESGKQFISWFALTRDDCDKPYADVLRSLPTQSSTGRLRLVRVGSVLSFLAAEGENGEYKRVYRDTFRTDEVERIRIGGYTGGPEAALDARVIDVRVRTKAKLDAPGALEQGPGKIRWLPLGGVLALVIGSSLLGLWWFARRGRQRSEALAAR